MWRDQTIQGAVRMQGAKCRVFTDGKPQLDLEAPEATWDGKVLRTQKATHGVTADGETVIDAQSAVWTANGGELALVNAKLQSLQKGKPSFTVDASKASVNGDIIL